MRWGLVGQLATLAVSFRCLSKCDLPTMLWCGCAAVLVLAVAVLPPLGGGCSMQSGCLLLAISAVVVVLCAWSKGAACGCLLVCSAQHS